MKGRGTRKSRAWSYTVRLNAPACRREERRDRPDNVASAPAHRPPAQAGQSGGGADPVSAAPRRTVWCPSAVDRRTDRSSKALTAPTNA
jgi:hypothetical protein